MTVDRLKALLSGTNIQNLRETKPPLKFPAANLASAVDITEPFRERATVTENLCSIILQIITKQRGRSFTSNSYVILTEKKQNVLTRTSLSSAPQT